MSEITQNTDYQVQWTPELREAVDNRIIEYLQQGYSQQEAEEKALQDQLDHTTFNYPEVTVSAQAPVQKQVATESDWDPGYTKFMSGERYYADQDHKNYLDWQRNDYTRGIRETTDKWGKGIGLGMAAAAALPFAASAASYIASPAGWATIQPIIGETAKSMLGYMAVDKASQVVSGKTFGQNIADTMGYIPGLRKIPYQHREFLGSMANPGAYWSALPGAAAKMARGLNQIDNAIDVAKYNVKAGALAYGSQFAAEHPQMAGNLLKVKPGVDPSKSKIAQFKLDTKKAINNYNIDNAPERVFGFPADITSTNGIQHPSFIPQFDWNTGRRLSFRQRATFNPSLQTAIREHRYTPLMSIGEKRAYIQSLNQTADDALGYVKKFNQYADDAHIADQLKAQTKYILSPEELAIRENYFNALGMAEIQGIPYTSGEFRNLAKTYNLTDDQISRMKFTYRSDPSEAIFNDIQYSKSLQNPEWQKETFSVMHSRKAPKRTFVKDATVPIRQGWLGQYNSWDNTLDVVVKETPRIVKHPTKVSHTIAHEYDHWAQHGIPRVDNTNMWPGHSKGLQKPYYTVNINSPAATEFPELQGVPYVKWGSSPHEWRSEMAGYGFSNNLPSDVKLWTPDDMENFSRYLQSRWQIREMTELTRQGEPFANFDPAYTTQKMVLGGYKSGGKLNYLNYFEK